MREIPDAIEVKLRKLKPMAPPFHRHIVRSKLLGRSCRIGDKVVVYEVVDTLPKGDAFVTEQTLFRFE